MSIKPLSANRDLWSTTAGVETCYHMLLNHASLSLTLITEPELAEAQLSLNNVNYWTDIQQNCCIVETSSQDMTEWNLHVLNDSHKAGVYGLKTGWRQIKDYWL